MARPSRTATATAATRVRVGMAVAAVALLGACDGESGDASDADESSAVTAATSASAPAGADVDTTVTTIGRSGGDASLDDALGAALTASIDAPADGINCVVAGLADVLPDASKRVLAEAIGADEQLVEDAMSPGDTIVVAEAMAVCLDGEMVDADVSGFIDGDELLACIAAEGGVDRAEAVVIGSILTDAWRDPPALYFAEGLRLCEDQAIRSYAEYVLGAQAASNPAGIEQAVDCLSEVDTAELIASFEMSLRTAANLAAESCS